MDNQFNLADNTVVVTTKDVIQDKQPILLVSHDVEEDGTVHWGFYSGHAFRVEDMMFVSLSELLDIDATLNDLAGLPANSAASRESIGGEWKMMNAPSHR